MRAISLYQPFASLMGIGRKRNETRSRCWRCLVGQDIAICSSKSFPSVYRRMAYADEPFITILSQAQLVPTQRYGMCPENLPLGVVLCVVRVDKVFGSAWYERGATTITRNLTEDERAFGDYRKGRFVYETSNLRKLKTPVAVRGYQGIFHLPADVEREVRKQIDD